MNPTPPTLETQYGKASYKTLAKVAGDLSVIHYTYYSPTTKICIIRVARDHHRIAWAAITLITELRNQSCIPHVIHVSGTLKKVQLAAIQYNRVLVAKLKARSNEERQKQLTEYLEKSDKDINTIDAS
ncbi:hypothetical protein FS837_004030 [Tulasnella sp. UAMH 9824]|nr:hypothetical protein FS837_004030 [Tulasnella sp. UAMH 9824]